MNVQSGSFNMFDMFLKKLFSSIFRMCAIICRFTFRRRLTSEEVERKVDMKIYIIKSD